MLASDIGIPPALCYHGTVVRVVCPHCSSPVLLLVPTDEGETVVCPLCGRAFTPDEEEWVDPEDA